MSEEYKEKFKKFLSESPLYIDNPNPYSDFNEIEFISEREYNKLLKQTADVITKTINLTPDEEDAVKFYLNKFALRILEEAKGAVYKSGIFNYVNKDAKTSE